MLKCLLWEKTEEGNENNTHSEMNDKVDFVSVPLSENNLQISEDTNKVPQELVDLRSRIEFKGNIRLFNFFGLVRVLSNLIISLEINYLHKSMLLYK